MPIANSWWERGHVAVFRFLPHLTPTSLPSVTNPTCFFVFFACVQFLPHPPPRPTPPHFIWLFKKCFVPEVVFCCSFVFPRVSSSVALLSFFCIFVTSHWLNGELLIRSSHFSAPYPHPFLAQTFFYHHYYITSLLCSHPLAAKHANISDPQKISPKLYI